MRSRLRGQVLNLNRAFPGQSLQFKKSPPRPARRVFETGRPVSALKLRIRYLVLYSTTHALMNLSSSRLVTLVSTLALAACANVPSPPPGAETDRTFTTSVTVEYQEAFRTVARRSTACFGQSGMLSINHMVQSDLDAVSKVGRVEVFPSGLFNQAANDRERKSYVTRVVGTATGTEVTTIGPSRKGAYLIHLVNLQWISGVPDCAYRRP